MRPSLSSKRRTVDITLERNFLLIRNTLLRNIISSECIKNGQNLAASVTLSKQRKCNRLGHFQEFVLELCLSMSVFMRRISFPFVLLTVRPVVHHNARTLRHHCSDRTYAPHYKHLSPLVSDSQQDD
jgi:uncharacterized membrane protein